MVASWRFAERIQSQRMTPQASAKPDTVILTRLGHDDATALIGVGDMGLLVAVRLLVAVWPPR